MPALTDKQINAKLSQVYVLQFLLSKTSYMCLMSTHYRKQPFFATNVQMFKTMQSGHELKGFGQARRQYERS